MILIWMILIWMILILMTALDDSGLVQKMPACWPTRRVVASVLVARLDAAFAGRDHNNYPDRY